jgi:hypothetical protein
MQPKMLSIADRILMLLKAAPLSDKDYFALTLHLGEGNQLEHGFHSHWVGYTDTDPPREIRQASHIHAQRVLDVWKSIGEPGLVVNSIEDVALFFAFGGHAVVEESIASAVVPQWLQPVVSVPVGQFGFASPCALPKAALTRAPTPKLRMSILKRDGYKCRICGRCPERDTDIELHVHHIRPWARGGVSEEANLIALCHTCHKGLCPHFEHSLFEMVHPKIDGPNARRYVQGLIRYQQFMAAEGSGVAKEER